MENMTQCGPKAPKDPERKRPHFYIMRGKEIFGSPMEDGTGMQYLFQSDGRLESSARLTGGITDEEILKLLSTTEGLRKLVHSIGVTVEAENAEQEVQFYFQMYGKSDPYVSGTTISTVLKANGAEKRIVLSEENWYGDDVIPGQIRFAFEKAGDYASVSICFYVNDGYEVPKPEEEYPVDFESNAYEKMLKQSFLYRGNLNRLKRVIEKAASGEEITLGFIGGSITQGAGAVPIHTACYAYRAYENFCRTVKKSVDQNVFYRKAGVGGTSSELGLFRYETDLMGEKKPDLVVVEFAVNDEGDETKGECYDSLVRKIYDSETQPAVVLLFSVFDNDWNLQERLSPVGYAYELPMISIKDAVVPQFYKTREQGKLISKNQFFYDSYHPSNMGHRIMADALGYLWDFAAKAEYAPEEIETLREKEAPIGGDFAKVRRFDRGTIPAGVRISQGDFSGKDEEIQAVERNMDLTLTPQFSENWMLLAGERESILSFSMDICCKSLFLIYKDSSSAMVGTAEVFIDGEKVLTVDPHIVGWIHTNAVICARNMEDCMHHVEVRMKPGDEKKAFTILGWGYDSDVIL